jgi:hypothetical protein
MYKIECDHGEYDTYADWQHLVSRGRLSDYLSGQCEVFGRPSRGVWSAFLIERSMPQPGVLFPRPRFVPLSSEPEALLPAIGSTIEILIHSHGVDASGGVRMRITRMEDSEFEASVAKARAQLDSQGWTNGLLQFDVDSH